MYQTSFCCVMEKLLIFNIVKLRVDHCGALVKEAAEHYLVSDIKRDILKFDTVLLHSNWSKLQRKYLSKIPTALELWAKGINDFENFGRHFSRATSAKILAVCTHVCRRRWYNLF